MRLLAMPGLTRASIEEAAGESPPFLFEFVAGNSQRKHSTKVHREASSTPSRRRYSLGKHLSLVALRRNFCWPEVGASQYTNNSDFDEG
jgi:hypothetical protein